jgi:hypothetical protein
MTNIPSHDPSIGSKIIVYAILALIISNIAQLAALFYLFGVVNGGN